LDDTTHSSETWSEDDSSTFLDAGRFFVPRREEQIRAVCSLVPQGEGPFRILELCPGEGLLAEAMLKTHPEAGLLALDGSEAMRTSTRERLKSYGERAVVEHFDLLASDWRQPDWRQLDGSLHEGPYRAIVSSLAVHHLDGPGKKALFLDLLPLLEPGGALILADLVEPVRETGLRFAADSWDQEVLQRSREILGNDRALRTFREEAWNHYRHPDPVDQPSPLFDQLLWLRDAGYADVDVYWLTAGHAIYGGSRPEA